MHVGSTGAGVNIEQGVTTRVSLVRAQKSSSTVILNGSLMRSPTVSTEVIRRYLELSERGWKVTVSHLCELPIGRGYGTSGAGALSLSLSLNKALGEPLTVFEAAAVAHESEISARTGLGTVTSVFFGGLLLRLSPGCPGLAHVEKIAVSKSLRVVSGSITPISKRRALSSTRFTKRVNRCSIGLLGKLRQRKNGQHFVEMSRRFADCLDSATPRLRQLFRVGDEHGITFSMMMIGESCFTIVPHEETGPVVQLVRGLGFSPVVSRVEERGGRLL